MTALAAIRSSAVAAEEISRDRRIEDRRNDLVSALTERFYNDPKLAYGLVTGACVWPPVNGEDLGTLANWAFDAQQDCQPWETTKVDQFRAAEAAFCRMEKDEEAAAADERDAEDAMDGLRARNWSIGRHA